MCVYALSMTLKRDDVKSKKVSIVIIFSHKRKNKTSKTVARAFYEWDRVVSKVIMSLAKFQEYVTKAIW